MVCFLPQRFGGIVDVLSLGPLSVSSQLLQYYSWLEFVVFLH